MVRLITAASINFEKPMLKIPADRTYASYGIGVKEEVNTVKNELRSYNLFSLPTLSIEISLFKRELPNNLPIMYPTADPKEENTISIKEYRKALSGFDRDMGIEITSIGTGIKIASEKADIAIPIGP